MVAVLRKKIRVILADDHPVVRDGLAAMVNQQPDMEVVAEAGDGEEAIALYERGSSRPRRRSRNPMSSPSIRPGAGAP